MPKFVVEREIPGAGKWTADQRQKASARSVAGSGQELGPQIQWVESYVTDDKLYCVIAPSADLIRTHAQKESVPRQPDCRDHGEPRPHLRRGLMPAATDDRPHEEGPMPKFLTERDMPGARRGLAPDIRWVRTYVTGDRVYCIHIAASADLIRVHAERTGVPANRITEIRTSTTPPARRDRPDMYVSRGGIKLFYQVVGPVGGTPIAGEPRDVVLLPQCQPATYSRMLKHQVPYLSRYFRVITMDQRGNGRSDRPATGYDLDSRYADMLAVLEETVRPPFALVAMSCAGMLAFRYAAEHPDRLSHLILLSGQYSESVPQPFEEKVAPVIRDDFDNWRNRLFTRVFAEPHSLKGIEDCYGWCGETTAEVLVESLRAIDGGNVHDLLPRITTPTLALHGTKDRIVPYSHAEKLVAAIPGASLVTFQGGGHALQGRDMVKVNRLIRDFVQGQPVATHRSRPRPSARRRRRGRAGRPSAACSGCRARSASGTSSGTSRSRGSSARCTRTSLSTSSPPTRPTAWSRPWASACTRPRAST